MQGESSLLAGPMRAFFRSLVQLTCTCAALSSVPNDLEHSIGWTTADHEATPVRIALYCSGGASSCKTSTCCEPNIKYYTTLFAAAQMAFGKPPGFTIANLTAAEVVKLDASQHDVVVFPGGSGECACPASPCRYRSDCSRHKEQNVVSRVGHGKASLFGDIWTSQAMAKHRRSAPKVLSPCESSCLQAKATSAHAVARSLGCNTSASTCHHRMLRAAMFRQTTSYCSLIARPLRRNRSIAAMVMF